MSYLARKKNMTLAVIRDVTPSNPRVNNDNFGTMFCWHDKYNLGDSHDYDHSYDFLEAVIYEHQSSKKIIDFAKTAYSTDFKYDKSKNGYVIFDRASKSSDYREYDFIEGNEHQIDDDLAYALLDAMMPDELLKLAHEFNLILPIYLYDHSGLSINTTGFSCKWDSGKVGYIYVSHKDIESKYGNLSEESIERAKSCLMAEVKEYGSYLCGDCYGFRLLEKGEEIDSCWGFIGDFDEIKEAVASNLPENHRDMVNELEYVGEDILGFDA